MAFLEISALTMRFGGLVAVHDLSLEIEEGEIRGLIGPNGAGKSTVFNTISRYYPPAHGEMHFMGYNLLELEPHHIPGIGIGRTFQNLELFGQLTVLDNVLVGQHSKLNVSWLHSFLKLRKAKMEDRAAIKLSMELLEFVGLSEEAHFKAANLAFGKLKKLELARALASKPRLLLLDEPAAGMIPQEIEELDRLLKVIRDKWGVTILLVEHVMQLVMGISDRITVINFGEKIAEDTPPNIRNNQKVVEAYLGRKG
jgi:branched-chain amino acid transport system ATP-binding protein